MLKFIKQIFVFLIVALIISFVLIPAYEVFVGGHPYSFIKQHIIDTAEKS